MTESKLKKLHISVITLFPDIFDSHLKHLPLNRAISKNLLQVDFINLRDFAIDKRGTVDSLPYGGGPGMILRPEPIFDAIDYALKKNHTINRVVFLTPRGETYTQNKAIELAKLEHLVLICGRYEGIDQRVIDYFTNQNSKVSSVSAQELSIGRYVLSGGEVPAMVILESVVRLIPGAIDNPQALQNESFNLDRPTSIEHPQYSRPEEWRGLKVPKVLISGHHKNINAWKMAITL